MPKTSVSFRKSSRPEWRGFTLLEMLVVLVLLGFLAGMAVPMGVRTLRNAEARSLEHRIGAVLDGLPQRAFRSGGELEVDASSLAQEVGLAPDQGELELTKPLLYRADGSAEGGDIVWHRKGQGAIRWRVEPLTGEARLSR